jgi:hypothetical protein
MMALYIDSPTCLHVTIIKQREPFIFYLNMFTNESRDREAMDGQLVRWWKGAGRTDENLGTQPLSRVLSEEPPNKNKK